MGARPMHACALVLGALAWGACGPAEGPGEGPEPAPARSWPPGTVLAVEDLAITAEEVDLASVWVERIERDATTAHLRRLALTRVVLPRHLTRLLAGEAREAALAEARATLASLRDGSWTGPLDADGLHGEVLSGGFNRLGLEVWGVGSDLSAGTWSEPIEDAGRFLLLRRTGLRPAPVPMAIEVDLDALIFPFVDPTIYFGELEGAYDRFHLTIVDPAWRELVPESIQYRMGVSPP